MFFRRAGLRRPSQPVSANVGAGLQIGAAHSRGKPLDPATRAVMEPRLGHDFSDVRVHDSSEAASAARALGARALTYGNDIVVAANPGQGNSNLRLLAHELAHVAQQRDASILEPRLSEPGDPSERAAEAAAEKAVSGAKPSCGGAPLASLPAVLRQADTGAPQDFRLPPSPWFQRATGRLVIDGFPTGQSTLTGDQRDRIKFHASLLKTLLDSQPGGRVSVTGHGDAVGTDERNMELGLERAKAVAEVLVAAGIPEEVIDTDSAGKSTPAVPAKGADPANRRAVIGFTPPLRLPGFEAPALTPPTFDIKPPPKLDIGPSLPKPRIGLDFPGTRLPPPGPDKPGPRAEPPEEDWWKRSEEMMRRAQEIEKKLPKDNRSPVERLGDAVVQVLEPLIRKLPVSEDLKKKAREGIRDGVKSGSEKACEAAIDASGAKGPEANALKAACKGVIEYKPGEPRGGQP
jgi:outer membrane protein OmpA-like peptidoglycan-associated protein